MIPTGREYLDRLAARWREAYAIVNGKDAPEVVWKGGWFEIGGKRYRRSVLEGMHTRLQLKANAMGGRQKEAKSE